MRILGIFALVIGTVCQASASWTDKVSLSGDLRYRHEMRDDETVSEDVDHRQRLRTRLKLVGEVNEDMKAIIRLTSGGDSITSTNQTLGTSSTNKEINIDLAYVDFQITEAAQLLVGKMTNPIYRPNKADILWDGDVTPEGLAFSYQCSGCGAWQYFANAAATWIDENTAPTIDLNYYAAQLGTILNVNDKSKLTFGLGNHNFSSVKGKELPNSGGLTTTGSNSTDIGGGLMHEYNLSEVFLDYSSELGECPYSIYANFVTNPDSENDAYVVGLKFGKIKAPLSYSVDYNFKRVEKDAVLSLFNDSDFNGGQTDAIGHTLKFAMAVKENTKVSFTYSVAERGIDAATPTDYKFTHLDVEFSF